MCGWLCRQSIWNRCCVPDLHPIITSQRPQNRPLLSFTEHLPSNSWNLKNRVQRCTRATEILLKHLKTLKSSLLICVVIWRKVGKQDKKWIAARMGRELAIGFTSWGFPLVWSCNSVTVLQCYSNTDSTSTHWTHESRKLKLQVILGKASICPGLAFSFGGVCQVLTSTSSTLQTSFSHTWVWLFIEVKKNPLPPFLWRVSLLKYSRSCHFLSPLHSILRSSWSFDISDDPIDAHCWRRKNLSKES